MPSQNFYSVLLHYSEIALKKNNRIFEKSRLLFGTFSIGKQTKISHQNLQCINKRCLRFFFTVSHILFINKKIYMSLIYITKKDYPFYKTYLANSKMEIR